jgi:hypothetical protein
MIKRYFLLLLFSGLLFSCKQNALKNTRWRMVDIKLDSVEKLSFREKVIYGSVSPFAPCEVLFEESEMTTYISGKKVDVAKYEWMKDSLRCHQSSTNSWIDYIRFYDKQILKIKTQGGIVCTYERIYK